MTNESRLTRSEWLSRRRNVFAIASAVWMSFAVIHVFQTSVLADATNREWTLWGGIVYAFPWWLSWLILTPLIAWLADRYPFTSGNPWRAFAAHTLLGLLISTIQLLAVGAVFWFTVGQYAGVAASLVNQLQRFFGNFFLESVVTYAGTTGVFTAIDFARAVRDESVRRAQSEARAAALETSVTQARLDALSMQMNPHFLFNTLTAISGLVAQERKVEAREVIQRLGELLRQSLGDGNGAYSTVAREAALLEDYLYIQRLRFSDRLDATVDIDPAARDCVMPSMLLQPMVENAIRHGVEPREGRGTVRVEVTRQTGNIHIHVTDSGAGFALGVDGRLSNEGIGIANTRERLEHIYGDKASLVLQNGSRGGAEALVTIPVGSGPGGPHHAETR